METRTNNNQFTKATDRINRLCESTRSLSKKDNVALSYILEKTSRIASVTLLLADVLDRNAELQGELQRSAIGLVRDAAESAHSFEKREIVSVHLRTLSILLDTAGRAGQLSKMNAETLTEEILGLLEFLHTIDWNTGRRFVDDGFFGGSAPMELFTPEPLPQETQTYKS